MSVGSVPIRSSPLTRLARARLLKRSAGATAPVVLVAVLWIVPDLALRIGEASFILAAPERLAIASVGLALAVAGWRGSPFVPTLAVAVLATLTIAARDPLIGGIGVGLLGLVAGLALLESSTAIDHSRAVGRYLTAALVSSGVLVAGLALLEAYRFEPDERLLGRLTASLVAVGLALRLGAAPMHAWLVDAVERFGVSGAVIGVVTADVAVVMVAVRVLRYLPAGYESPPGLKFLLTVLLVGGLLAALGALAASSPLRLVAYALAASNSLVLFGLGTGEVDGVGGSLLLVLVQPPAVAVLALCLGRDGQPAPAGRYLRGWTGIGGGLAVLTLAGAPPTVGFAGWWLLSQAARPQMPWLVLLTATSTVLALAAARVGWRLAHAPVSAGRPAESADFLIAAALGVLLLFGGLTSWWLAEPLLNLAGGIAGQRGF